MNDTLTIAVVCFLGGLLIGLGAAFLYRVTRRQPSPTDEVLAQLDDSGIRWKEGVL